MFLSRDLLPLQGLQKNLVTLVQAFGFVVEIGYVYNRLQLYEVRLLLNPVNQLAFQLVGAYLLLLECFFPCIFQEARIQ